LLAFATSLPEFSIGINAALSGVSELSLGDIFGTNIVNITPRDGGGGGDWWCSGVA
jgi:Ca2+/Na+ antiporter